MRFNEALHVRLQEKYRRLYKTSFDNYGSVAKYVVDWIATQPELSGMLQTIARSEPDTDPQAWFEDNSESYGRGVQYPDSEVGFAKVAWWLLTEIASEGPSGYRIATSLSPANNMDDAVREFTNNIVEPLIEYLQERLSVETDVLYTLERYRRRVHWFEADRLWAEYQADTRHGEDRLDADLRQFLFDQGIDYPFSQPSSASGKADVVALLETEDPLVCEIKLFDGDDYATPYLAKGLNQAVRYAEDYDKDEAYLVVFNLSDRRLQFPTDDESFGWPPRINTSGRTIFLVAVQVAPMPSASQQKPSKPHFISRDQLIP